MAEENKKNPNVEREEKVLDFWQKSNTFKKSLEKDSPKGEFVFYDGPPFATGMPHYGHLLAGTIKDIVPRYQTMIGKNVKRRWGWDCHGLPIENLVQKELGLKGREDIEKIGIETFNNKARSSVFLYDAEWKKIVPRTGRFVDMENSYTTMDNSFMESVWWAWKTLDEKGLAYEGFKIMHVSPELETPLSNFEVAQGYKDITDISAFVKFELIDEPGTFVVAWTTTPWTLPGNVALAVKSDMDYVYLSNPELKEKIIVAKPLAENVIKKSGKEWLSEKEIKGADLVGKKYKPLFDYYAKDENLKNLENGWQIYAGDFVTTEDGSGVVHIAPAFGEDDYNLLLQKNLPFIQHVEINGRIKSEVTDFAGLKAKPKGNPRETDEKVVAFLEAQGKILQKENFVHSYPHCWRTDAPLLNYAMSSWFVRTSSYKDRMVELNKGVKWIPETIGKNRFENWLENIKDWSVSRSRYWGTPIPVWKSEDGEKIVIGSVGDLKGLTKSKNKFMMMRHGEADHNINQILASDNSVKSHLTEKGKTDAKNSALQITEKIDWVYVSPLDRTQETAQIVSEVLGISKEKIITDVRLKEVFCGTINGQSVTEYRKLFTNNLEKFERSSEGGETLVDIKKRVGEFIYEIDKKHTGENILIITHEYPLWMLTAIAAGLDRKKTADLKKIDADFVAPATLLELDFAPIPHNGEFELDLHRPYIDQITFEKDGKVFKKIPEVFDTWFDSGSMPFAEDHYPFENKDTFLQKRFPADFIAEGLDQTRGWFYTLLAMNVALFDKAPYKNVLVNGLALAENGKKMSKSLNNYPDPSHIIDSYGADSLRLYMVSSPIVQAEDLRFSEKGVDEVSKKFIARLYNVVSFYEMYKTDTGLPNFEPKTLESKNILDRWIISRLGETTNLITESLNAFELDRATRPLFDFIEDLSVWYLRRSRERFKGDDYVDRESAIRTTKFVLEEFSKLVAPFAPFCAEWVYQKITDADFKDENVSVHLCSWSEKLEVDQKVLDEMKEARAVVNRGLDARTVSKIKVRQPLASITHGSRLLDSSIELKSVLKDELNIKELIFDEKLKSEDVVLDSNITPELELEGIAREFVRGIQTIRKDMGLSPSDPINLFYSSTPKGKVALNTHFEFVQKTIRAKDIKESEHESSQDVSANEETFKVFVEKI